MKGDLLPPPDDTRDRLIRVESDLAHLRQDFEKMSETLEDVHNIMTQAKGARWMILLMATVGGFVATKGAALIGLLK